MLRAAWEVKIYLAVGTLHWQKVAVLEQSIVLYKIVFFSLVKNKNKSGNSITLPSCLKLNKTDHVYESTEVKKLAEAEVEAEVPFEWPKPKPKFNQIY